MKEKIGAREVSKQSTGKRFGYFLFLFFSKWGLPGAARGASESWREFKKKNFGNPILLCGQDKQPHNHINHLKTIT